MQLAQTPNSGAYLVTRGCQGKHVAVPDKPFNTSYRAYEGTEAILINGEQVTKIVARKKEGEWYVTFHLSDGTAFTPTDASDWAQKFVSENFPNNPFDTP
jgi:hypothetical protein